jgi:3-hydroxyisobutyrate dehydrogenase-like beta-hydroxyacid dehydrogenase
MGSALASVLLKQGHEVAVWNRTPSRCRPLVNRGAVAPQSIVDALAASDVVIVNVIDYSVSDDLLHTADATAALAGKTVVQLTSGSPAQAREAHAWAAARGIDYLDGAIMSTPNYIGTDAASLLYAGSESAFAMAGPAITLFGVTTHVGTDPGLASAIDVALLTQMWGKLFGTLQAIAVCGAEGVELDTFSSHIAQFAPTVEGATEDLIARARDGRLAGDDQTLASIAAHYAAYHHLQEIVREKRLDAGVPDAFDRLFQLAINRGHLNDDFAALVPLVAGGA